ncbi:integral membrane protein [Diplocarpon mali]|nr:integral membrane protein [Diplocarpon mali]
MAMASREMSFAGHVQQRAVLLASSVKQLLAHGRGQALAWSRRPPMDLPSRWAEEEKRGIAHRTLSFALVGLLGSPWWVVAISSLWLYFAGSFFFDVAHYALHKFSKSKYLILRQIGYLHEVHHLYFNRRLKFNNKYLIQNMVIELPLELSCQLFGTWLGYRVAQYAELTGPGMLSDEIYYLNVLFEIGRVFVVACLEGRDSNHKSYPAMVPKDPNSFTVGPQYHAMHHVDPSSYISSCFRVFDWLLGTSSSIRSRRITMTGASGAFGSALKHELLSESPSCIQELKYGTDWTYTSYSDTITALQNTDILILSHGSKTEPMAANCVSAISLIELFKQHYTPRPGYARLLPEVWYVGSEAEVHPSPPGDKVMQAYTASKRAFARHARKYYDDETVLYRHIVPAAFRSRMGWAIVGPRWAAKVAMWWIRRGARYVPVTYTGFAYLGYAKFLWVVGKADEHARAGHAIIGEISLVRKEG